MRLIPVLAFALALAGGSAAAPKTQKLSTVSPGSRPNGADLTQVVQPSCSPSSSRSVNSHAGTSSRLRMSCTSTSYSLPAQNLKLDRRGALQPGYFADVVIFDPAKIQDHATFEKPHQFSTGVRDVFVNGVQVLKDGEHTGAKPGRVVRGPGWKPAK